MVAGARNHRYQASFSNLVVWKRLEPFDMLLCFAAIGSAREAGISERA